MSERSHTSQSAPSVLRGFLAGLTFAALVFVAVHRLDLAMGGAAEAAAAAVVAVLTGRWLGAEGVRLVQARRKLAHAAAIFALVLLWVGAAFARMPCGLGEDLFLLGASALLLRVLFADVSGVSGAFVCGCLTGFSAMSAGLAELVGVRWVGAGAAIIAAGASIRRTGGASPTDTEARSARAAPAPSPLLLCASAGVLAVAMLRTYSYTTGWFALAASDLAVAACAGLLLGRALGAAETVGAQLARALALAGAALVLQASFVFYPYLVFSEAAVLQSARSMVELGRVFPVWALAAAVSAAVPRPGLRDATPGVRDLVLAGAAGAGACLLIPCGAWYGWHYVLAVALAMTAAVCVVVPARRSRTDVQRPVLWTASLLLLIVALGWSVFGAADIHWHILRRAFVLYQVDVPGRLNPAPVPRVPGAAPTADSIRFHSWGLTAHVSAGDERGAFVCGNLASSSRGLDSGSVRLGVALATACAAPCERIGILEPALTGTHEGVGLLAPDAKVFRIPAVAANRAGRIPGSLDAVICDPGPLTCARCPLAILSLENLTRLRGALREQGVLVIWLPTRTVSPAELARVLSTVTTAFPGTNLFQWGDEAVLVCGGKGLSYGRLAAAFREPASSFYLGDGGFWDARQILTAWTAGPERLRELARGMRPYELSHPCRPPVLARDLVDISSPGTLAVAAQYRLAGPRKLVETMAFRSASERNGAIGGFTALYAARTDEVMAGVGQAARQRMGELLQALYGPQMALDLFAAEPESRHLKAAAALHRFGLHGESLRTIAERTWSGEDAFHAHYLRGRDQEALGRKQEAVASYEAALKERPRHVDVTLRLARMRVNAREEDRAVKLVEQAIAAEPDNVDALVFLSYLYGRRGRRAAACALAERALKLDPDNRLAQDLCYLYAVRADAPPLDATAE